MEHAPTAVPDYPGSKRGVVSVAPPRTFLTGAARRRSRKSSLPEGHHSRGSPVSAARAELLQAGLRRVQSRDGRQGERGRCSAGWGWRWPGGRVEAEEAGPGEGGGGGRRGCVRGRAGGEETTRGRHFGESMLVFVRQVAGCSCSAVSVSYKR